MLEHFLQRRLLLPVTTLNNGKTAINRKLHNKKEKSSFAYFKNKRLHFNKKFIHKKLCIKPFTKSNFPIW